MHVTQPNNRTRIHSALGAILFAAAALATPGEAGELNVVATIKPVHALVAQVMEGVGTPTLLVQGAASPHSYALKPSDARTLNNADVFFRVSESVEPFTRKIATSLPDKVRVVTLAAAPDIELLDVRRGETFEAHDHHDQADHGHGSHDHADHDHGAHDDHGHAHHDHGGSKEANTRDGHVWLDPANARKMVADIARALSEAAPAHRTAFETNAARAEKRLVDLEAEIARDLAPVKGKPYVVFHDAYQYFERRFDLAAVGSITVSPDAQPSAKRLSEIRKKLTSLSASCVFAEPQFKPKLVAAVTEGTSARAGTLDPEGALVEPGPAAYDTLIRNLATSLKSCLISAS